MERIDEARIECERSGLSERSEGANPVPAARRRYSSQPVAALIAGAMLATTGLPSIAQAAESDSSFFETSLEQVSDVWRSTVDIAVLRPLGVGRLVLGGVLLVPSTIFNLAGMPFGRDPAVFTEDFDRFLVEPAEYTFTRPVGEDLVGG